MSRIAWFFIISLIWVCRQRWTIRIIYEVAHRAVLMKLSLRSVLIWSFLYVCVCRKKEEYVPQMPSKRTLLDGSLKSNFSKKKIMSRLHNMKFAFVRCVFIKNHVSWSAFDHVSNGCICCIVEKSLNLQPFKTWSNEFQNTWFIMSTHLRTWISYCVVGSWIFF